MIRECELELGGSARDLSDQTDREHVLELQVVLNLLRGGTHGNVVGATMLAAAQRWRA